MPRLLLLILAFAPIYGCGYTTQVVIPNDIETIYVDTVKNQVPIDRVQAYQPGLEIDITNAIINRLHEDGNLRVVEAPKADAVLEAILVDYEQEGIRFSRLENVQEFRLFVVLSVRLYNPSTEEVYWEEPNFSGSADYVVTDVRTIGRAEATGRVVERVARNIVDRIVEDW